LTITDNGAGIPDGNLDKIFDPYFSTKQIGTQKGMGLGLAICYSIVRNSQGLISVESTEGKGTSFSVYLPAFSPQLPG
jgi:signal transduction histidine kinase